MSGLKGKIVLITGASSGIGAGTALHMAKLGCKLSLVARNRARLDAVAKKCREAGSEDVFVTSHDLSIAESCVKAVEETVEHFKGLDVLVNNAGIMTTSKLETLTEEEFDQTMNINVKSALKLTQLCALDILVNCAGVLVTGDTMSLTLADYDSCMNINTRSAFVVTQACLPHLIKTKGNIVNVSSVTGLRAFPGVVAYNMSKAALDMLTRTVALEVADKGVRVNAVNPGVITTNIHKNAGMDSQNYVAFLEHSKTTHAMGRVGEVREVAEVISFLASESASFITGQTLAVDGGRSVMCPR